jgi:hypothetical protein
MSTPSRPQLPTRLSLNWALFLLPGLLVFLVGIITSSVTAPFTLLSPLSRLGFALLALGLLLQQVTVEALLRFSPSWPRAKQERRPKVVRHPQWLRLADWWRASAGALAFALVAIAPDAVGAWFAPSGQDASYALLSVLVYLTGGILIASTPPLILNLLDPPR